MHLFNTLLKINKSLLNSLYNIFGLGSTSINIIYKRVGISTILKTKYLLNEQLIKIIKTVNLINILLSHSLKKHQILILKTIINIKSIKGYRILKGLPVKGQRTKTNAKTCKKFNYNKITSGLIVKLQI